MRHACDLLGADGAGVAIGTRPPWWRGRYPSQRKHTRWLLSTCTNQHTEPESMVTTEAIDLLASKLPTPLSIRAALDRAPRSGNWLRAPVPPDLLFGEFAGLAQNVTSLPSGGAA